MPVSPSLSPHRWAADLTKVLGIWDPSSRFPINVETFSKMYSGQRWSDDPILEVVGDAVPGLEGALIPVGKPRRGWTVLYNTQGVTEGRRRFTLAHEFGHYLLHRHRFPAGIRCDEKGVARGDGALIEKEADQFAAAFLMPLDDMRQQIGPKQKPGFDELGACAIRYGVSLTALTLRWLAYTERRSLLIVSRDGYALYARSSEPAFRSRRFVRTSAEPYELPSASCAAQEEFSEEVRVGVRHPSGIWFDEEVEELSFRSDAYDQVMTLLHLDPRSGAHDEPAEDQDVFERLANGHLPNFR